MSERIFLTYTNATAVPYQGSVLGHHVVLNYIDSNGVHHTLQGVPEHRFDHNIDKLLAFSREEMFSDGANNRDSPFQRLHADPEGQDRDVSLSRPHTMVAESDDLSSRWALMQDFADEVNSTGYEYRPISQNSNSFAGGALQRAGFFGPGTEFPERFDSQLAFDPASGETRSFNVPGFEKPLANPINTATPMPFPLGAPAAPDRQNSFRDGFGGWGSSPAGIARLPSPDRPASFDDRFGNWGSAPAGDAPRSPVPRAPQNYKRSVAPDGRASTSAQSGPPPDAYPPLQGRRVSSAFPSIAPRDPNQPVPPPERAPPIGISSGKPMSLSPFPLPLDGLPDDNSNRSGNINWFDFLAGPSFRNPRRPAPPPTADSNVRKLSRRIVDQAQASEFDASARASLLIPSDDPNFSGGLLGRLTALAGIDPRNPTQLTPTPLDDGLRGFYRDDAEQPWFVQRQR